MDQTAIQSAIDHFEARNRLFKDPFGAIALECMRAALQAASLHRPVEARVKLDARLLAIDIVDRHGYTMEFAPSPAAHRDEYDDVERVINRFLETASLPSPQVTREEVAFIIWEATGVNYDLPLVKKAADRILSLFGRAPMSERESTYKSEKHCCTICDRKKVCHVCKEQTLFACSDCRINFNATVYVCSKPSCRDEHERKCYGARP